jgi:nucleotide-binding universal stress UspA family protein
MRVAPTVRRIMERSVVSAFDPDAGDLAPVALGRVAAEVLAAGLLVVVVRPGGSVPERFARLEDASERAGVVAGMRATLPGTGVEVRELGAPSPSAGLHAVVATERPVLAVLGSSRAGAHGSIALGRTTERVLDGAPCPVAVAPKEHASRPLARIAVGVLPSPEGREALRAATRLAAAAGAALHVVMVLAGTPDADEAREIAREIAPDAERLTEARDASSILGPAIAAATGGSGADASVLVGDPVESLLRASDHADVLLLGSRAYGPPDAVGVGGVARRILDGARCPVVIVPRGESTDV